MRFYFLYKVCKETDHVVYIYETMTTYERWVKNKEGWLSVK